MAPTDDAFASRWSDVFRRTLHASAPVPTDVAAAMALDAVMPADAASKPTTGCTMTRGDAKIQIAEAIALLKGSAPRSNLPPPPSGTVTADCDPVPVQRIPAPWMAPLGLSALDDASAVVRLPFRFFAMLATSSSTASAFALGIAKTRLLSRSDVATRHPHLQAAPFTLAEVERITAERATAGPAASSGPAPPQPRTRTMVVASPLQGDGDSTGTSALVCHTLPDHGAVYSSVSGDVGSQLVTVTLFARSVDAIVRMGASAKLAGDDSLLLHINGDRTTVSVVVAAGSATTAARVCRFPVSDRPLSATERVELFARGGPRVGDLMAAEPVAIMAAHPRHLASVCRSLEGARETFAVANTGTPALQLAWDATAGLNTTPARNRNGEAPDGSPLQLRSRGDKDDGPSRTWRSGTVSFCNGATATAAKAGHPRVQVRVAATVALGGVSSDAPDPSAAAAGGGFVESVSFDLLAAAFGDAERMLRAAGTAADCVNGEGVAPGNGSVVTACPRADGKRTLGGFARRAPLKLVVHRGETADAGDGAPATLRIIVTPANCEDCAATVTFRGASLGS